MNPLRDNPGKIYTLGDGGCIYYWKGKYWVFLSTTERLYIFDLRYYITRADNHKIKYVKNLPEEYKDLPLYGNSITFSREELEVLG